MSKAKRQRQKAKRRERLEAENPMPTLTEDDFDQLLVEITVRDDCAHASTRATSDGLVLTRCAAGAAVSGGCPRDCKTFEKRRASPNLRQ